jgi:hypothetical protein
MNINKLQRKLQVFSRVYGYLFAGFAGFGGFEGLRGSTKVVVKNSKHEISKSASQNCI